MKLFSQAYFVSCSKLHKHRQQNARTHTQPKHVIIEKIKRDSKVFTRFHTKRNSIVENLWTNQRKTKNHLLELVSDAYSVSIRMKITRKPITHDYRKKCEHKHNWAQTVAFIVKQQPDQEHGMIHAVEREKLKNYEKTDKRWLMKSNSWVCVCRHSYYITTLLNASSSTVHLVSTEQKYDPLICLSTILETNVHGSGAFCKHCLRYNKSYRLYIR